METWILFRSKVSVETGRLNFGRRDEADFNFDNGCTCNSLLCASGRRLRSFFGKDVKSQLAALAMTAKPSGSGGAVLGDYKSHAIKLSVRTASGGAEVHAHYDDIFIVPREQQLSSHAGRF